MKKEPSRFVRSADARPGDRFRAGKRLWSRAEDAQLRREYPNTPTATLAQRLRRSKASVYERAAKLGLGKSEEYLASPVACRLRRGDNVGAAFRFKPGQEPANKGLRRPGWHSGRMKETQFRRGERHGVAARRWQPVGSTRQLEGYTWIKVADTQGVPWTKNWRQLHVVTWEEHRGPVPPGHVVVFRDGNRTDVRIENLELVTRQELMARNTYHRLPKPLAQLIQLRGALTRQINKRSPAP